jgi:hypothetical protein
LTSSQPPGHRHVTDELAAPLVVGFLQRQRLVEDVATSPGKAAHVALLSAPGQEFELESLAPPHAWHCTLVLVEFDGEHDYLHVLVNYPPKISVSR